MKIKALLFFIILTVCCTVYMWSNPKLNHGRSFGECKYNTPDFKPHDIHFWAGNIYRREYHKTLCDCKEYEEYFGKEQLDYGSTSH